MMMMMMVVVMCMERGKRVNTSSPLRHAVSENETSDNFENSLSLSLYYYKTQITETHEFYDLNHVYRDRCTQ